MGQMKPGRTSTSGTGNGKGTSSRLSGLEGQRRTKSGTWGDVDPKTLMNVLEAATEEGALISMSKTGDGGAMRLYIKHDREAVNFYGATGEEMDGHLAELERRYRE